MRAWVVLHWIQEVLGFGNDKPSLGVRHEGKSPGPPFTFSAITNLRSFDHPRLTAPTEVPRFVLAEYFEEA